MILLSCDTMEGACALRNHMEPLETIKAQIAEIKPTLQGDYYSGSCSA